MTFQCDKEVSFLNSSGKKLRALLNDAGGEVAAILCHGFACHKNSLAYPNIAKALGSLGISSLRFDFAGNGESEGTFLFGNYHQEVSDLRCAVEYVRRELQKSPICIVGHSKGGNVVLMYSALYGDVPLVVNIAGRFVMKRGIKEQFGEDLLQRVRHLGPQMTCVKLSRGRQIDYLLTQEGLDERLSIDMEDVSKQITRSRVLTVHGTQDAFIPSEDALHFARCIPQHKLHLVEGADHFFKKTEDQEILIKSIADFVSQNMSERLVDLADK